MFFKAKPNGWRGPSSAIYAIAFVLCGLCALCGEIYGLPSRSTVRTGKSQCASRMSKRRCSSR